MTKGRLEAFSDGVIAIIITIMVLELKVPHENSWEALRPLLPRFLSYLLSFVFLAIYWNNHHHLLQAAKQVSGKILWANMHLLFWLSLIPFATGWMGEHFGTNPVALYATVLMACGIAYYLLVRSLVDHHGKESDVARASGADLKGGLSVLLYAISIGLAFIAPWASCAIFVAVALLWLIPDRRLEASV
jgi:uncharacterized membrane protein